MLLQGSDWNSHFAPKTVFRPAGGVLERRDAQKDRLCDRVVSEMRVVRRR